MSTTYILIVDTTIRGVAVGFVDANAASDAALVWYAIHPDNQGSSAAVAKLVREGLEALSIDANRLGGIAVGVGPGSFTGIKVGLAFVMGFRLGMANPPPILSCSALGEFSRQDSSETQQTAVFLPATSTHGYAAVYSPQDQGFGLYAVDVREAPNNLLIWRSGLDIKPDEFRGVVAGDWPALRDRIQALGRQLEVVATDQFVELSFKALARRARESWPQDYHDGKPEPLYLRKSTPEERLQTT